MFLKVIRKKHHHRITTNPNHLTKKHNDKDEDADITSWVKTKYYCENDQQQLKADIVRAWDNSK